MSQNLTLAVCATLNKTLLFEAYNANILQFDVFAVCRYGKHRSTLTEVGRQGQTIYLDGNMAEVMHRTDG